MGRRRPYGRGIPRMVCCVRIARERATQNETNTASSPDFVVWRSYLAETLQRGEVGSHVSRLEPQGYSLSPLDRGSFKAKQYGIVIH
jgi:hypothetical protein